MKSFGGKVLFLDRSDINTDEIIPARYLTEVEKPALKVHLLEDLKMDGFVHNGKEMEEASVIVARENFGCGSSREHAPWALEENGFTVIIAPNYARIFRQNMFNNGIMAIELSEPDIDKIMSLSSEDVTVKVDVEKETLIVKGNSEELNFSFELSPFDKDLVLAGGWLEYADNKY